MKRTGLVLSLLLLAGTAVPGTVCAADKTSDRDWQQAYQKVLTTYARMQGFEGSDTKDGNGSRWDLCDIDGDGSPELFVSPDVSHAYGCMIYTCIDGEPKLLQVGDRQAFGEFGMAAVSEKEHLLGSFHTGMGVVNRDFYKLERGELVEVDSFMSDVNSYPEEERDKAVWMHNRAEVPEAEYEAAFAPYADIVWKEEIGREYAFSDRSPLAAPLQSAEAADPPDLKTAVLAGSLAAFVLALVAAFVSKLIRR